MRVAAGMMVLLVLAVAAPATAAPGAAPSVTGPFAPYAFLVGEWNVSPAGAPAMAVARFVWGPNQSYLWYSLALLENGEEQPHFEGLMVWNGARRDLDMLLILDLMGGRIQEQGPVSIRPDGTVVREITATYAEGERFPPRYDTPAGPQGATAHFRQTFRASGPDTVLTSATRETKEGWVATFPGSERLIMTRRQ